MQRGGEGWVSRDHQCEAARAANAGEVAAERRAVSGVIVAQDDAGEATRQTVGGLARIRQPLWVGE
jgi:hypothetical protein